MPELAKPMSSADRNCCHADGIPAVSRVFLCQACLAVVYTLKFSSMSLTAGYHKFM